MVQILKLNLFLCYTIRIEKLYLLPTNPNNVICPRIKEREIDPTSLHLPPAGVTSHPTEWWWSVEHSLPETHCIKLCLSTERESKTIYGNRQGIYFTALGIGNSCQIFTSFSNSPLTYLSKKLNIPCNDNSSEKFLWTPK